MRTRAMAFAALFISTLATASEKQPHTYQKGTITGWNTQHYSRAYSVGGRISSAPGHKKFYELRGADMTYQLNDCGSFQAGQAVEYRIDGKKVYILGKNGKEQKCSVEGVKTNEVSSVAH